MVFFNCNACGESLKKNAVEKHYQTKCRKCEVLSCIDCGKDFWGNDYQKHVKCISEDEKYSGKNFVPKANANKGEQKQELWCEQVQVAIDSIGSTNPALKNLLVNMKSYSNIPRKKAKFENFLKNSFRGYDFKLFGQAWEILEEHSKKLKQVQENEKKAEEEKQREVEVPEEPDEEKKKTKKERKEERKKKQTKPDKKKKRKHNDEDENQENEVEQKKKRKLSEHEENGEQESIQKKKKKRKKDAEKEIMLAEDDKEQLEESITEEEPEPETKKSRYFDWEAVITSVLKKADDEISMKKLRKKVLAEYLSQCGDGNFKSEEKLWAKFEKKVTKNPKFKVIKDKVKLAR